jgi:hypothetical protein
MREKTKGNKDRSLFKNIGLIDPLITQPILTSLLTNLTDDPKITRP